MRVKSVDFPRIAAKQFSLRRAFGARGFRFRHLTAKQNFRMSLYAKSYEKFWKESKGFPCETCGKVFEFQSYLNKHRLCHTKPFQCVVCQRWFARKDHLKSHFKTHSGKGEREGRGEPAMKGQGPPGEEQAPKSKRLCLLPEQMAGLTILKGKSKKNVSTILF